MYVLLEKQKFFVCGLKIPAFAGTTVGGNNNKEWILASARMDGGTGFPLSRE
jgi:hypothetical protein